MDTDDLLKHELPLVRWGVRAWLVVGLGLALWGAWHVAGLTRIVISPLLLALFPAAVLLPVVDRLNRRMPRSAASLIGTLGFVLLLAGVLTLLGWQVAAEMSDVTSQFRDVLSKVRSFEVPGLGKIEPSQLLGGGSGGGGDGGGAAGTAGGAAVSAAGALTRFTTQLFLGIVALFFYLRDGERIAAWIRGLFPSRHREDAERIGERSWGTVAGYIRGQTVVALFDGTFVAIGLLILGVPLAIALGVLVFFGAFVPVVGSITAGAIAVLVALVSKGLAAALITLAIVVGVQQIEGNLLAPYVLGHEVELHPLAVLVAIIAGAAVLGVLGAIIAVPITASIYHAAGYLRERNAEPA